MADGKRSRRMKSTATRKSRPTRRSPLTYIAGKRVDVSRAVIALGRIFATLVYANFGGQNLPTTIVEARRLNGSQSQPLLQQESDGTEWRPLLPKNANLAFRKELLKVYFHKKPRLGRLFYTYERLYERYLRPILQIQNLAFSPQPPRKIKAALRLFLRNFSDISNAIAERVPQVPLAIGSAESGLRPSADPLANARSLSSLFSSYNITNIVRQYVTEQSIKQLEGDLTPQTLLQLMGKLTEYQLHFADFIQQVHVYVERKHGHRVIKTNSGPTNEPVVKHQSRPISELAIAREFRHDVNNYMTHIRGWQDLTIQHIDRLLASPRH